MTVPPGAARRLLVVTNDFPPRAGGIQSFVHGVVSRLDPDKVVVYTSRWRGWEEWDAAQPYPVIRAPTSVLLPTPQVRRHTTRAFHEHGCTDVWFGAAAPLGLLAPAMRVAGARRIVATTHGHEAGWAVLPGARALLRRVAGQVDVLTYLGEWTSRRLTDAVGPHADRLQRLVPGVDADLFTPGAGNGRVRRELGVEDRPVVVCVSRLMPRKGQDVLVRAWPRVQRRVPGAVLILVGGGPSRSRLSRLVHRAGLDGDVILGGSVPADRLPEWYAAGDVFAMPCRERLGGLDIEGLGMVFLEAAACGLPVVAGRSGGSPDAVDEGRTGLVIDGRSVAGVAEALTGLLTDSDRASAMGRSGREWVLGEWAWDRTVAEFTAMLKW
jgi:phosphatidylinositol alpha-1,6-mannosyltransferase